MLTYDLVQVKAINESITEVTIRTTEDDDIHDVSFIINGAKKIVALHCTQACITGAENYYDGLSDVLIFAEANYLSKKEHSYRVDLESDLTINVDYILKNTVVAT